MNPQTQSPGTPATTTRPGAIPPPFATASKLTYELTRWDLAQNHLTIPFRNRLVQIIILVAILISEALVLRNYYGAPLKYLLLACLFEMFNLLGWLAVSIVFLALAISFFFKQRGVVGQHALEITERGLSERTDYNENLTKWASIRRFHSTRSYLYIYVTDFNFYAVPKRYFTRTQIAEFEAQLRARAQRARELPGS